MRDTIGRFNLLEPLAGSGLGMIVRALDRETGEEVALKLFHPPPGTAPEELGNFVSAMTKLIALDHPHIVRVFAAGVEDGVPFVAREWLAGGSLAEHLGERPRLSEREVLAIALQAASALAAAEGAGVLHRDLEPGNLIFADAATIKVGDFAQAAFFDRASLRAGTVWGALPYVAPERFGSDPEDARSDIYTLGATLFHALTGEAPFGGETQGEALAERIAQATTRVDRTALVVHPATAAALEKMLALAPSERPRNWRQVQELLRRAESALPSPLPGPIPRSAESNEHHAGQRSERSRHWATAVMLVLLTLVAGGAAWQIWKPRDHTAAESIDSSDPPVTEVVAPVPPRFAFEGWSFAKIHRSPSQFPVIGEAEFSQDAMSLRLTGSNDGIGGRHDAVVFQHRQLTGDWTLSARIAEVNGGVAGLMVRHDVESSGWFLAITFGEDGNVVVKTRLEPEKPATETSPIASARPCWLRVSRHGPVFTAEHSPDGTTWQSAGSLTPPAPPPSVPAGFITHALAKPETATATFDRFDLQTAP